MRDKLHINLDQVVSINVYLKIESRKIEYHTYKKLFGLFKLGEDGFYRYNWNEGGYILMKPEEIEHPNYVEGNKVFLLPHLDFHMTDKSTHTQYYKTKDELHRELHWIKSFPLKNLIVITE